MCLKQQFTRNPPTDWDFKNKISYEVKEYLRGLIMDLPELISEKLLALQPRKTLGLDGISNTTLQRLPERGDRFLVDLFNACLRLSYILQKWCKASHHGPKAR